MRGLIAFVFMGLAVNFPAQASTVSDGPELAARFFNTIPDVCFQTARGHAPTKENAASLLLEPATDVPPTVKAHFGKVTNWFRLQSQPNNVFVGVGDRPNACHVVLANTTQTAEIQKQVIGFLKIGGFQTIKTNSEPGSDTDMIFVKKAPDGYMLISLQAPRSTLRDGGSCPERWCSFSGPPCFSTSAWADHEPGTADSMTMGLSLSGAIVSSVM